MTLLAFVLLVFIVAAMIDHRVDPLLGIAFALLVLIAYGVVR